MFKVGSHIIRNKLMSNNEKKNHTTIVKHSIHYQENDSLSNLVSTAFVARYSTYIVSTLTAVFIFYTWIISFLQFFQRNKW